jgi:hypothetical protein
MSALPAPQPENIPQPAGLLWRRPLCGVASFRSRLATIRPESCGQLATGPVQTVYATDALAACSICEFISFGNRIAIHENGVVFEFYLPADHSP